VPVARCTGVVAVVAVVAQAARASESAVGRGREGPGVTACQGTPGIHLSMLQSCADNLTSREVRKQKQAFVQYHFYARRPISVYTTYTYIHIYLWYIYIYTYLSILHIHIYISICDTFTYIHIYQSIYLSRVRLRNKGAHRHRHARRSVHSRGSRAAPSSPSPQTPPPKKNLAQAFKGSCSRGLPTPPPTQTCW
jgi:hypothetical protein